ncbi:MAG: M23 family metallopeptidase [Pseudanabaena sp.]
MILNLLLFKLGLVATFLNVWLAPAFGQTCLNGYGDENLEEKAPFQRVGTIASDRDLALHWTQPAEFTEITPFSGKAHELAKHEGIDFIHSDQSVSQVAVRSVADGKVVYVRFGCPQSYPFEQNTAKRACGGYWGNHVVILHRNGMFTRYSHLSPDSIQVRIGQQIRQGDEIAKMGNSGLSDTRHLHFELGVAIEFNPCKPAQSLKYVYNPANYLGWVDLMR